MREQREAVVVIVPDDFAERFRSSRPAPLQLVADGSRNDVGPSVQRVQLLLQQYAAEISSLRLIMRGVSPAAMRRWRSKRSKSPPRSSAQRRS